MAVIESVNQTLHDSAVDHAVDMQHFGNGIVRRIIATLNRTDADLAAQLTAAVERLPGASFTVEWLDALLISVRALNAAAYAAIGRELADEAGRVVEYEAGHQLELFRFAVPPQVAASVGIAQVNVAQVYAAALSRPFQGRLLAEWATSIESDRMARIRDAVRMGYVEQQTMAQIVRRVVGTKAKGYADGIIEIDRRNAEAVVRTAISHTAGFTRDRFYEANSDLVKAVVWTATLDSRTSEICRLRDSRRYENTDAHKPIDHKLPWLGGPGAAHWQCRSTSVPVTKSWAELGGADIPDFSGSTRESMDGQVPVDTTYASWIKRQSAGRQDEILGPTRGKLLRSGGLTLDRFANEKGKWLTLDELRKKDAAAFKAAGLP